ncbi:hypothetical protein GE061_002993 [Apolygus lucorum]|uniref:C2H2-type domain-containing protein n=1 Tax=Apolygus lucorum TaxID=248454 RepID=A0A8S9X4S8_APOLU|nr:hypothetical protein GE061_002993 [Apolygus lucorum]
MVENRLGEDLPYGALVPGLKKNLEPKSKNSEANPLAKIKLVKVPLQEDPTKFKIVPVKLKPKPMHSQEEDSLQGVDSNVDLNLERHECSNCGRSYKHIHHLKAHLRECSNEPLFSCDICHKRFYHSRNLGRHLQKVHNGVKKTESEILSESAYFVSGNSQCPKTSSRVSSVPRFFCVVCGRSYKYKQNLNAHRKYECGMEPRFECRVCFKKFKVKSNFKAHLAIHGEIPVNVVYKKEQY